MKANPHSLQKILGEKQQWVVPVYQRHYEWETGEDKQIAHLWDDLTDKAEEEMDQSRTLYPHYFGAVICSDPQVIRFGATPQRSLIDGQQRITTFNIVLAALKETARKRGLPSIETALKSYLFNDQNDSMIDPVREKFKLWPSSYDRELFAQIVTLSVDEIRKLRKDDFYKNGGLIKGKAPKLLVAFDDLLARIDSFIKEKEEIQILPETSLTGLIEGFLKGFQLVLIELDDQDDAQEIFASLNGLAKPLAPFDLIRNDVFLRSKKLNEDSENLFLGRWKTFEAPFWTTEVKQGRMKRARADHLIAHSVVAETGREVSVSKIASEYQRYARDAKFPSVSDELDSLLVHAESYRAIEEKLPKDLITPIAVVLECWDSAVFYPLLLWANAYLDESDDKIRFYHLIECYIIRREICGLTPKNYNKIVTGWIRAIRGAVAPVEEFEKLLQAGDGEISRFPTNPELADAFESVQAYDRIGSRKLRYILSKLENALRTKKDEVALVSGDLTIEHIMPMDWANHWPLPNGQTALSKDLHLLQAMVPPVSEDMKIQVRNRSALINTFGNLTLLTTSGNPSVGNKGWNTKGAVFRNSLLALNRNVGACASWDEEAIKSRSRSLGEVASRIWSI